MKTVADLKVGDTVWIADINARGRPPYEDVVTKIGTKLITVGRCTYRKEGNLSRNDNYGHQWLILSLEDEQLRRKAAKYARQIERHGVSSDTSIETLRQVASLLGIKLED